MFKSIAGCDDAWCMSDLSNLLGAVYGSSDPDGPSTRHEPSAAERVQVPPAPLRIDDDLAAALSQALVTSTPDQAIAAPAPVPAYAPPPSAPAAVPTPAMPQNVYAAPAYVPPAMTWCAGDDDIFPVSAGKKR